MYSVAMALAGLALIPTILGFEQELTRRGSLDPQMLGQAMRLTFAAILLGLVLGTLGLGAFLGLGLYPAQVVAYSALTWVAMVFARLQLPFRHHALVRGRPELSAVIQAIGTTAIVGATAALIIAKQPLWIVVSASILIQAVVVAAWFGVTPRADLAGRWSRGEFGAFVQSALPFGISNVLWTLYFNIDSIILSLLKDTATVGIYGAAFRIVAVSYTFAYAMTNVFTPLLFSAFERDPYEYAHQARRMMTFLLVLAVLVCGSLFVLAGPIVRNVLGPEYGPAMMVIQVLCVATFVRFVNYGLTEILTTSRRQWLRLRLEGMLLIANIVATLLLVPHFGALGAALACVAGEVLLLAVALRNVRRCGGGTSHAASCGTLSA